jgi:hypothetical protein
MVRGDPRPRDAGTTCGHDVAMAHQSLDDVDVLSPAHEARGVVVPPPLSKVPTGQSCPSPSLYNQIVQRPRPVTTTEAPVAPWVGEQVQGHREIGPQLIQVLAEHVRQLVGDGRQLAALADERDTPSVKVGLQVHQFFHRWFPARLTGAHVSASRGRSHLALT